MRRAAGEYLTELRLVWRLLFRSAMRVVFLVAWFGVGCATMPQPAPVLGSPGQRMSVAIAEALPYLPTRAVVRKQGAEPVVLEQRLEARESAPAQLLFDPRLSFVRRIGRGLEVGGHVGWWMTGLELRMSRLGDLDPPLVVTVGAQVDATARFFGFTDATIGDVRAHASVHPTIHGMELILGAGLSAGRQKHDLVLSEEIAPDAAHSWRPLVVGASRREARLEGVVGIAIPLGISRIVVTMQPFRVIADGAVSTIDCTDCMQGFRVESLDAPWGAAFTLTLLVSVP
jgi:hypothetical protein